MSRDALPYDLVIIGAGPSGLAAAIRFKQLAIAANTELSVCVVRWRMKLSQAWWDITKAEHKLSLRVN